MGRSTKIALLLVALVGLVGLASGLGWFLTPLPDPHSPHHPEAPAPWTVTPSLYPGESGVAVEERAVRLVQLQSGEIWLDGSRLGRREEAVTVEALRAARPRQAPSLLYMRSPRLSPEVLWRWLRAVQAAGFDAVAFEVHGTERRHSFEAQITHARGYRFTEGTRRGWVQVRLTASSATVQRVDVAGGPPLKPLETANGVELYSALLKAHRVLEPGPEACVEVQIVEPISTEHLLNALAIASSVPVAGDLPAPSARGALFEALARVQRSHCATLSLR